MDYENFTLVELRQLAKEKGTKNVSKLKKEELIILLRDIDNNNIKEDNINEFNPSKEADDNTEDIRETNTYNLNNTFMNDSSSINYKVTNEDDNIVEGILEVLPDGYGFLRGKNYLSSPKDVYISPIQIKRFRLGKGDKMKAIARTPK